MLDFDGLVQSKLELVCIDFLRNLEEYYELPENACCNIEIKAMMGKSNTKISFDSFFQYYFLQTPKHFKNSGWLCKFHFVKEFSVDLDNLKRAMCKKFMDLKLRRVPMPDVARRVKLILISFNMTPFELSKDSILYYGLNYYEFEKSARKPFPPKKVPLCLPSLF